jgi:hypothetical protein
MVHPRKFSAMSSSELETRWLGMRGILPGYGVLASAFDDAADR